MCCQPHHFSHGCCYGTVHFGPRRFLSREEKIEELTRYKESLQKEIAELERRIKRLEEDNKDHNCCCW